MVKFEYVYERESFYDVPTTVSFYLSLKQYRYAVHRSRVYYSEKSSTFFKKKIKIIIFVYNE